MNGLLLPHNYTSKLSVMETQLAIKLTKDTFERELARALNLTRVSAPLFVCANTGLNDDLNGIERPVQFDAKGIDTEIQIVHSLAKWKRFALHTYGFAEGAGLYADMNAIRRDEDLDHFHSLYVDQWDWEKVIAEEDRNFSTLQEIVRKIVRALAHTQDVVCDHFSQLPRYLSDQVTFITSQELEDRYPSLSPKEREHQAAKEFGVVFISQIGHCLRSGAPHDGRAPDYDDWMLNGDILIWYPLLETSLELSSMGIRVNAETLEAQLRITHSESRSKLPFHQMVANGTLPLSVGGGIGQSRICMALLQKAHIGEVHASTWPEAMITTCAKNGVYLL